MGAEGFGEKADYETIVFAVMMCYLAPHVTAESTITGNSGRTYDSDSQRHYSFMRSPENEAIGSKDM